MSRPLLNVAVPLLVFVALVVVGLVAVVRAGVAGANTRRDER
jgi:hypothetical protein